jgi:AraC-like DNA-binding protein
MLSIQSFTGLLAISQLLFMGLSYLVYYHSHLLGRLIALYCCCLIAYIILTMPEFQLLTSSLVHGVRALAVGAPAVLWLIARHVFADKSRISSAAIVGFLVYIIAFLIGAGLVGATTPGNSLSDSVQIFAETQAGQSNPGIAGFVLLLIYIPYIVMLLLAMHSVYMATAGAGADLVEPRRQLRVPFIVAMGIVVILIVGSGLLNIVSAPMRILFYFYIFICTLFFNLVTFRLHEGASQLIGKTQSSPHPIAIDNDTDKVFLQRIYSALEKDSLYTNQGLTIGKLAIKMGSREYLLRRFVNQNIQFRNFNQFLNEYRIRKVAARLENPHEPEPSVANIALDAGFASLSVFNRVFKEIYSVTPTNYRNQHRNPG